MAHPQIVTQLMSYNLKQNKNTDLHLIFDKWILTNSIFGLFQTWILQATEAVKIKFEIYRSNVGFESIFCDLFASVSLVNKNGCKGKH